jgi:DNA-binding PadR family transcriptional regulator
MFQPKIRRGPIVLSSLELHALLATAALQPRAYGNSVVKHISEVAGYKPITASIYVALSNLAKKGFVTPTQGTPRAVRGGRRICYWNATEKGNAALSASVNAVANLAGAAGLDH